MFALIFLSLSGALGFRKEIRRTDYKRIALFSILTISGSLIGASFILAIEKDILKKVIAILIILIAGSFFLKKDLGILDKKEKISKLKYFGGTGLVFILGIYGGFFSGGYITFLSYVLILIFGLNFLQAAFVTKILNIFSSLVACAIFYFHDLIDFSIGIPLALSMALGAFLGTKLALAKGNLWIRNLFIVVVMMLAISILIF